VVSLGEKMEEIIKELKQNQIVLAQLRQNAIGATTVDLIEINETIQLIRYNNESLIKELLKLYP
jgi:hypothetical protein